MAIVNERKYKGDNSEQTFELQIRDLNQHDLPDVDGDDDPDGEGGDGFSVEGEDSTVVKVVNTHDQDLTVSLEATNYDDGGFAEPYAVEEVTVVAGGGVELLGDSFSAPVDFYRIVASAGTEPTDGSVKAVFLTDVDG